MEKTAGNGKKGLVSALIGDRAILVPATFDPAKAAALAKGKAPKAAPAKKTAPKTRDGSKTEKVIAMLRKGATCKAIVEAAGWQVDLKQLAARKNLKLKKNAEGVIRATGGL